jgi:hypothetical protein
MPAHATTWRDRLLGLASADLKSGIRRPVLQDLRAPRRLRLATVAHAGKEGMNIAL